MYERIFEVSDCCNGILLLCKQLVTWKKKVQVRKVVRRKNNSSKTEGSISSLLKMKKVSFIYFTISFYIFQSVNGPYILNKQCREL